MKYLVLCPGSRSGPIAIAAERLVELTELKLITCLDERSAAYRALGIATATGNASAVVTTSGTAVANLLPAAVEADRSCQPILFITADRPLRLKECGANQTVNQQEFLRPVCRFVEEGPKEGIHQLSESTVTNLGNQVWHRLFQCPGPVHLNLSFEEPLHPCSSDQKYILSEFKNKSKKTNSEPLRSFSQDDQLLSHDFSSLDISKPGIIIAGPWRGLEKDLSAFLKALKELQIN